MKMFELGPIRRAALGQKAMAYAHKEFGRESMVESWDKTLMSTIDNWRGDYKSWETKVI